MEKEKESGDRMIAVLIVVLFVYNIVFWIGRFLPKLLPALTELRLQFISHWGLFIFLELLGIVSLFVDMVIQWDRIPGSKRKIRLVVTAILCLSFVARFGFGVIDMYMSGEPR